MMTFKPPTPNQKLRAFGNDDVKKKALAAFEKGDVDALVSPKPAPKLETQNPGPASYDPVSDAPTQVIPVPGTPGRGVSQPSVPSSSSVPRVGSSRIEVIFMDAVGSNNPSATEAAIQAGAPLNNRMFFMPGQEPVVPGQEDACRLISIGTALAYANAVGYFAVANVLRRYGGHE